MPRKSIAFITETDQVIECDSVSVYPKELTTNAAKMTAMAGAPMRRIISEPDSLSPFPSTMVRRRRVIFIEEVPIQSNKQYGKWPAWLTDPESYRCIKCKRYCSDTFLTNGICTYCRGGI